MPRTEPTGLKALVDIDLSCLGCGYNLRTLSHDARCPECGERVSRSLRAGFHHLSFDELLVWRKSTWWLMALPILFAMTTGLGVVHHLFPQQRTDVIALAGLVFANTVFFAGYLVSAIEHARCCSQVCSERNPGVSGLALCGTVLCVGSVLIAGLTGHETLFVTSIALFTAAAGPVLLAVKTLRSGSIWRDEGVQLSARVCATSGFCVIGLTWLLGLLYFLAGSPTPFAPSASARALASLADAGPYLLVVALAVIAACNFHLMLTIRRELRRHLAAKAT